MKKLVSIIIRTLNEEKYLKELLESIKHQSSVKYNIETVIVDSGSSDNTLLIARSYDCKITFIKKDEFTFGRSLNIGCDFSKGDFLVFISGHCIPTDSDWISNLIEPLENECQYVYGKQVGRDKTKFSERQIFKKYFQEKSRIPQQGFFCNNANAAIRRDIWERFRFDESLTGLEDMELSKRLVLHGHLIGYVSNAAVYHIHDEVWRGVRIRYEREAIALQTIMPEVRISFFDAIRYILVSIYEDCRRAIAEKVLIREVCSIFLFRISQYTGSYLGNRNNMKISNELKYRYFYPKQTNMNIHSRDIKSQEKIGDIDYD